MGDQVPVYGDALAAALAPLETDLAALPRSARLPLLLLTPPALRRLAPADLSRLLETLDELVHADARVGLHEFTLQKVLAHHLGLAARSAAFAPSDVAAELSLVLTFAARLHTADEAEIRLIFDAGAAAFAGLHPPLALRPPAFATLDHLDTALDKLAQTGGQIKKRLLAALITTVSGDGLVTPEEAELVRALASALDCPMPPPA